MAHTPQDTTGRLFRHPPFTLPHQPYSMPNPSLSPLIPTPDAPCTAAPFQLPFPSAFSPPPCNNAMEMETDDTAAALSVGDSMSDDIDLFDSDCLDSTDSEFEEKEWLASQILQTAESLQQQSERTNAMLRNIVRLSQA